MNRRGFISGIFALVCGASASKLKPSYGTELAANAQDLRVSIFENAVRLNNGIWYLNERGGISPEGFGGIPGEVKVLNPTTPVELLKKQRKDQGFR